VAGPLQRHYHHPWFLMDDDELYDNYEYEDPNRTEEKIQRDVESFLENYQKDLCKYTSGRSNISLLTTCNPLDASVSQSDNNTPSLPAAEGDSSQSVEVNDSGTTTTAAEVGKSQKSKLEKIWSFKSDLFTTD
jgi:hypothetical protein